MVIEVTQAGNKVSIHHFDQDNPSRSETHEYDLLGDALSTFRAACRRNPEMYCVPSNASWDGSGLSKQEKRSLTSFWFVNDD